MPSPGGEFLLVDGGHDPNIARQEDARGRKDTDREKFSAPGVNPASLKRAVDEGGSHSVRSGVYIAGDDIPWPANAGLAATTLMNPGGVVCSSSAASLHVLSDDNLSEIWYAVEDAKVKNPDPVRTVFWLPQALEHGVETVLIGDVPVRIAGKARTVVDMLPGEDGRRNRYEDDEGLPLRRWELARDLGHCDQARRPS